MSWIFRTLVRRATLPLALGMAVTADRHVRNVEVDFRIDERQVRGPRTLALQRDSDGARVTCVIEDGRFSVPVEFLSGPVAVQLRLKGRHLEFGQVFPAKFETRWVVGIDTPPFKHTYGGVAETGPIREVWYVSFETADGDGTIATTFVR